MKVLLDTHIWIWMVLGDARLPQDIVRVLDNPDTELFLSAVSVWELMVLVRKNRISLDRDVADWARFWCADLEITIVSMDLEVAIQCERLQAYPHPDPGDRFIIATALVHNLQLATVDTRIRQWGGLRFVG